MVTQPIPQMFALNMILFEKHVKNIVFYTVRSSNQTLNLSLETTLAYIHLESANIEEKIF